MIRLFKLKLVLLYVLILINLTAISMVIGDSKYVFTQITLFGILVILIITGFYLVTQSHQDINRFLFALKFQDYSVSFPQKASKSHATLYHALNHTLEQIKRLHHEEQNNHQWMKELIQKIPLGILVLTHKNQVEFINQRCTDILHLPHSANNHALNQLVTYITPQLEKVASEQYHNITLLEGTEINVYQTLFQDTSKYKILFIENKDEMTGEIELASWSNLLRVMTHEIMNSVSSISSLSSTLKEHMTSNTVTDDMRLAINSIEKRSQGLIQFTENYREISAIKSPNKTWFKLSEMVQGILLLIKEKSVTVNITTTNEQLVFADRAQLEQVFINLILNAQHAVKGRTTPSINIHIRTEKDTKISVIDNGIGIPPQEQNQIFIPYYTTRKEGKGIGLTLCRKLMRNNNGRISLFSSNENGTEFRLLLKF